MITEGELQKRRVKRNLSDSLRLSDEPGSSCFGGLRPVFVGTDFDVRVLAERISPYTG